MKKRDQGAAVFIVGALLLIALVGTVGVHEAEVHPKGKPSYKVRDYFFLWNEKPEFRLQEQGQCFGGYAYFFGLKREDLAYGYGMGRGKAP